MSATLSIERPNADARKPLPKGVAVAIAVVIATGLLVAGAPHPGHAVTPPAVTPPAVTPGALARVVGTFTGSYENGLPVYRLPPVEITAARP